MSIVNAITSLTFPRGRIVVSYSPPPRRATGWIPDQPDTNDVPIEKMVATLTPIVSTSTDVIDLRQWCSSVEQQSQLGSCSAQATIGALEMRRIHAGFGHVDLSRLFVYYNARVGDGTTEKDEGSHIKLALESLSRLGVCKESLWPYDTSKVFARPTWKAYRDAYVCKINKYYRINTTGDARIEQIISALRAHHPVIFGVKVWKSFNDCSGHVQLPSSGEELLGRHAMLIVGVDVSNRFFIVRNSWGTDWGDAGYCYIPFSYLSVADADSFWSFTL